MSEFWNPWHGCTKISPGCKNCYVYRIDKMHDKELVESMECHKNSTFDMPIKKTRNKVYKIPSGSLIFTCFTSDFFLKDADEWRSDAWKMIKERSDCHFFFFTKRIDRFFECIPDDWGDGYDNVEIGCTVENQKMADYRLPLFLSYPIKHRTIGVEPMLERIDLSKYLSSKIEGVSCGGESGFNVRPCNYDWVLDLREQCVKSNVSFSFHQTGSNFIMNGKHYDIPRKMQSRQAHKAGIDFKAKKEDKQIKIDFEY